MRSTVWRASPTAGRPARPTARRRPRADPRDRLLDVGCGGGAFLRHVQETVGCEIAGVDHSRDMVQRSRPFAALGAADALPFEDGSFTAVSSIRMFMFCPDPAAVLREMHRVGGRLGLWTTAPEGRGTPAAPEPFASRGHFHTDTELVEYALAAGYSDARLAVRDEWSQLLVAQP